MEGQEVGTKLQQGLNGRRLSYIFAAVEAGSIRGAADRLNTEPSVVSRQIQILEHELGAVLLDRHGRGVAPTEAGRLVLDYYRRHLVEESTMRAQLEELKGLRRGHVRIAASEGFIEAVVETTLPEFNHKYPEITLTLNALPTARIVQFIADERVNIGLAFAPAPSPRVEVFARKRHPLHVIARHDHPIAQLDVVPNLGALGDYAFCLVPEEFGIGQLTKLAEHETQVTLRRAIETNSLQALRYYAIAGLGLTILPKILVARELEAGLLKAVRIRNVALEAAEGQILVSRRPTRSVAEQAMLESLVALRWFR